VLEHGNALAVLGRKACGDRHRFLVLDLGGETTAPLGIRQTLALEPHLALGARHGLLDLGDRDFRVHDRFAHLPGERSEIGGAFGSVESSAERVPQTLEQVGCLAQLLRMVFAKKSEKTGSTAADSHSGQAG